MLCVCVYIYSVCMYVYIYEFFWLPVKESQLTKLKPKRELIGLFNNKCG